jgi:hypothetical protein
MKKLVRYLLLSGFLLFVINTASSQSKYKKGRTEKHGRKDNKEKTQKLHMANKKEVEKLKQKKGKEKQKAHEKKLRANKAYVKAEKQRRKELANDEN